MNLTSFGAFSIKGADVRKFLQGQLTCDLDTLEPKKALIGAHCNREGRVVALYYLVERSTDEILLITPKQVLPEAMQALKHYGMFSKLIWQDLSASLSIQGFINPEHDQDLIKLPGKIPCYFGFANESSNEDESLWYYTMIQNQQVFLTKETLGKFLPQELDLEAQGGLSFTKGCYLGQEIIARLHYLGKLKRNLRLIESTKELAPLQELMFENKVVGEVICVCKHQQKCYALALIDINCNNTHWNEYA